MNLEIPELALVMMVGPSGAGKTTFAKKHFKETQVVSSDQCRAMVADDPADQSATPEAFEVLNSIVSARLKRGNLTVADATSLQPQARKNLLELARRHNVPAVAVVLNVPEQLCQERNAAREDRNTPQHTVRRQCREMHKALRGLRKEGFSQIHNLGARDLDEAAIVRTPMKSNRKEDHGPFDLIGDVHGCIEELLELLQKLGYQVSEHQPDDGERKFRTASDTGRKAVFLGDLIDRGPGNHRVLQLVMDMCDQGTALCVSGNHDNKLMRKLMGRNVQVSHGLAGTLEQLDSEGREFQDRVREFLQGLPQHLTLDGGRLVAAHAGILEEYQGRDSRRVSEFCHYGDTTGETDEYGLPVRQEWAQNYRGKAAVVYGHIAVEEAAWFNNTICVDTGACFGGKLTALRWPERELVSVNARETYYQPLRPKPEDHGDGRPQGVLDLKDVTGRRTVSTKLHGTVLIEEERAASALETMSRFALDPRLLVYLPPTMSPCETSKEPGYLERPEEALGYYRNAGVETVVCQEKHMGSRAVVILGRSPEAILERFGIKLENPGTAYSRTGRRFFNDPAMEAQIVARMTQAMENAGVWDTLESDWAVLDCEIMPWSLKAQGLLEEQYAPTAAAASASLSTLQNLLAKAKGRGVDTGTAEGELQARTDAARKYAEAYRRYCWEVKGPDDIRVAPFHVMATEGKVRTGESHTWHMDINRMLAQVPDGPFQHTRNLTVELQDPEQAQEAAKFWENLTAEGAEGMVVKPLDFIATGTRGSVQPAIKCRGPEYLRIIYGAEYDFADNLTRLRDRGLGKKRRMASQELALGIEGLERFVREEPLHRVHECAFGVLALESEPVDPRL